MWKSAGLGAALCAVVVSTVLTPPAHAHAYLLDEEQRERCFVQHLEEDVYGEYSYRWMGEDVFVYLECGTEGWGYTHIARQHRAEWQAQLDAGRAAGWNPEEQGIESWDDLMEFAVREAVERPGVRDIYTNRSKGCGIVELGFVDDGRAGAPRFRFTSTAVWDTDYGSIISAYPTTKPTC